MKSTPLLAIACRLVRCARASVRGWAVVAGAVLWCAPAMAAPDAVDSLGLRAPVEAREPAAGALDGGMQTLAVPSRAALRASALGRSALGTSATQPALPRPPATDPPREADPPANPPPRLLPASNPFQEFVQRATGAVVPMFGFDLFAEPPSTFAPVNNVPVTSEYVLGPGDELLLRAWGQVEFDLPLVVDREGMVSIPRVGAVSVAGVKFGEVGSHLKTAVGRVFRNFDLTVSMGQLRTIQVYVVGQARKPGVYTVSSLSTLVNAVFAAGGPNGKGSMRRVQLKRAGKVVAELDLYALLSRGDKSGDAALLPGDVIFFPNVGPLVAITGAVNTPAIYELREPDATLDEALGWGGGLATLAARQAATLERMEDRRLRRVDDFSLDAAGRARRLRDGDILTVREITPQLENLVGLKGFVARPGRYAFRAGMRVRDLLPDGDALVSSAFWQKRNAATLPAPAPGVQGEVLRNEIVRSEEINWDYAVIERLREDRSVTLLPFNLARAVREGDEAHNLLLAPGDIVTVFSKDDIRVPQDKRRRYITLEGEFAVPGIYEVEPGESLRALVARVGGFGRGAYLFGASFTRESVRLEQQQRLQDSIERMEKDFQRSVMQRTQAAATREQAESVATEIASQREFLATLKKIKAQGRVVLELPREAAQLRDLPDLELEDGDRFYVPATPSTVSVFGAVFNANSFIYRREKRLGDYLRQAGGPTRNADAASLYLLRADGSVASTQQSGWLMGGLEAERMMPGDAVVVPEALERFSFTREAKAWTEIFYQFALGVAGLRVLQNGVK